MGPVCGLSKRLPLVSRILQHCKLSSIIFAGSTALKREQKGKTITKQTRLKEAGELNNTHLNKELFVFEGLGNLAIAADVVILVAGAMPLAMPGKGAIRKSLN